MGLTICAYEHLQRIGDAPQDGSSLPDEYIEISDEFYTAEQDICPGLIAPLYPGLYKAKGKGRKFDIGGYGFYNLFRGDIELFCRLVRAPYAFTELLSSTDCDAIWGGTVVMKTYYDFNEYHREYIQRNAKRHDVDAELAYRLNEAYIAIENACALACSEGALVFA